MDAAGAPKDPEEVIAAGASATAEIDPRTTVGAVHLTVTDLERSTSFYRDGIGLEVLGHEEGRTSFGVTSPAGPLELVVLRENRRASAGHGYSGLYHLALLLPERRDLAAWLTHAIRDRVPLTGFADHFVSEALYLQDPDGHGIEIYRDRPRESWQGLVGERMTTMPLDLDDLMAELPDPEAASFGGLAPGTTMGHVHLRVSGIPESVSFYRDVLGFGLMAELGGQAAFVSAGDYHHHIGLNTWESAGVGAAPEGAVSLRHATVLLPDEPARLRVLDRVVESGQTPEQTPAGPMVSDPSGNRLLLALA